MRIYLASGLGFLGGSDGKESACNRETWVGFLSWEDPLEEGLTTHSSVLAWRIPWTEEAGGLHTPRGCKESDTTERLSTPDNLWLTRLQWYQDPPGGAGKPTATRGPASPRFEAAGVERAVRSGPSRAP